jgi:hypothetical protein
VTVAVVPHGAGSRDEWKRNYNKNKCSNRSREFRPAIVHLSSTRPDAWLQDLRPTLLWACIYGSHNLFFITGKNKHVFGKCKQRQESAIDRQMVTQQASNDRSESLKVCYKI